MSSCDPSWSWESAPGAFEQSRCMTPGLPTSVHVISHKMIKSLCLPTLALFNGKLLLQTAAVLARRRHDGHILLGLRMARRTRRKKIAANQMMAST